MVLPGSIGSPDALAQPDGSRRLSLPVFDPYQGIGASASLYFRKSIFVAM
jgi:hypothetical protein